MQMPPPLLLFLLPLSSLSAPLIVTPRLVDVVHIIDDVSEDHLPGSFKTTPSTTTTTTEKPEEKEERKEWPPGDYCIFSGTSGSCPENFAHGSIQLAVPINIGIGEMFRNGNEFENYVKVGRVGGVELSMLPYEQIYSLKLSACCRVETPKTTTSSPVTDMPFIF